MANPLAPGFHPAQLIGWSLGPLVGIVPVTAFQVYILIYPSAIETNAAAQLTIMLGVVGTVVGGGLGYAFSYLFDDPLSHLGQARIGFLFSLTIGLMLYSLISFPLLPFIGAKLEPRLYVLPVLGFISAFAAACLKGVINNLRGEALGSNDWDRRSSPR
jgi:hypothetical protein